MKVKLSANSVAENVYQVYSYFLLICMPEIPLKYNSIVKAATEEKLFRTCCDLDRV